MNLHEFTIFGLFLAFIIGALFVDLKVVGKKNKIVSFRDASIFTAGWVSMAIIFYFLIRLYGDMLHGPENMEQLRALVHKFSHPISFGDLSFADALSIYRNNLALEYITGYLIEYSLSIDNVFVMILIFQSFNVDAHYYKRVLFWGILGAIVMRFFFIFLSSSLIQHFHWILYVFGLFLIVTGVRLFLERNKKEKIEPEKHPVFRFLSRHFRITKEYHKHHFFIRENDKWVMTPLFVVLVIIEFTDVIFAVDSVPAIFAVTKDPYIVFFSNIFAILGLRSLFFLVSNVLNRLDYLKHGLAVLLFFIGIKMLLPMFNEEWTIPTQYSLLIICIIIGVSIFFSFTARYLPQKKTAGRKDLKL